MDEITGGTISYSPSSSNENSLHFCKKNGFFPYSSVSSLSGLKIFLEYIGKGDE